MPRPQALLAGRLVVASHNSGKVHEIGALLAPLGVEAVSAGALGLPEPEETETTFTGNAALKSRAASAASGLPALADDSGLEVFALGGDPGVYSARWAGPSKDFNAAMERVWRALQEKGTQDFSARFVCALALSRPDGETQVFEGEARGVIVWPPRGDKGFGYDPIFVADGQTRTFGEMTHDEKLPLTHRARAFEKLLAALR
ncbi:RdgB/HAM1 family non-canonical purine NTP pyrophosphatase [Terricaulis silvestris]|uniref:dITP/XTP pyrophosphatase n=1 Tax=Terricaulis silvestris TaxID=2686094 RepID=A0A6I6MX68_9CAUL|nr:RdgB/HAM1 family non-canonical purine NTP pyrophosphatase [Terricaulis silvestris]QGZ96984.1 Non-canonical purine NTP pyrophosphatase [Terricaulis silvestris]